MRPDEAARYARQILLEGVGVVGQERVLEATAAVGGEGLEHLVAIRYARRSGFARVTAGSVEVNDEVVRHPVAARFLAGSRAALVAFVSAAGGRDE